MLFKVAVSVLGVMTAETSLEFEFNEDPEGKPSASYGAGGEEELIKKLQKLKSELKACQKEKTEYLNGWQKERADFANYKKAEDDRRAMFSEAMRERILTRFLSVLDSFIMERNAHSFWALGMALEQKVPPA